MNTGDVEKAMRFWRIENLNVEIQPDNTFLVRANGSFLKKYDSEVYAFSDSLEEAINDCLNEVMIYVTEHNTLSM